VELSAPSQSCQTPRLPALYRRCNSSPVLFKFKSHTHSSSLKQQAVRDRDESDQTTQPTEQAQPLDATPSTRSLPHATTSWKKTSIAYSATTCAWSSSLTVRSSLLSHAPADCDSWTATAPTMDPCPPDRLPLEQHNPVEALSIILTLRDRLVCTHLLCLNPFHIEF
jgi:hypothetical protein